MWKVVVQCLRIFYCFNVQMHLIEAPSDQERSPRRKNHPAEEWVCIATSTSSLSDAFALSAHTYVCVCVCVSTRTPSRSSLVFEWLRHCCSFQELGRLTQTDLSASLWVHINMTKRTNRIGDITQ